MKPYSFSRVNSSSLARRVFIVCFLMLALPILTYFFITLKEDYRQKLKDTVLRLKDLGESRAQKISSLNHYNFKTLEIIEEFFHLENFEYPFNNKNFNKVLKDLTNVGNFGYVSFYTLTLNHRFICTLSSDPSKIGKDYTQSHYIQNTVLYNHLSFLSYGTSSLQRRFYVSKTVFSPTTHECIGILNMATPVDRLLQDIVSSEKSLYPIHFSLLTEDNIVFVSSHPDFALRSLKPLTKKIIKSVKDKKQFGNAVIRNSNFDIKPIPGIKMAVELQQNDQTYIAFFLPIRGTNLTLLLHAHKEDVFRSENYQLIKFITIFCLLFLFAFTLTIWITIRMSKPLDSLCLVMKKVSQGNLNIRYQRDPMGFEINTLGNIFNKTLTDLIDNMKTANEERIKKETLAREFRIGYDIQTTIIPRTMPSFPGLEITARYTPAKEVGGDFYDVFERELEPGRKQLVATIADAAGKGISACLYSLVVRSMLRSCYIEYQDLGTIMRKANNLFCQDTADTGMFVTVLTTIFDPKTKMLTYYSCGHNPGFILRKDNSIEKLYNKGTAMGIIEFKPLKCKEIQLQSDDLIILYTDGVTEAHNDLNELFLEKRLIEYVKSKSTESTDTLADELLKEIVVFSNLTPQHDDISLIFMRVL